jgi:hypothetical protein
LLPCGPLGLNPHETECNAANETHDRPIHMRASIKIGKVFRIKDSLKTFDPFGSATPPFEGRVKKRRFLRLTQDTEFIEVQGHP